MTSKSDRKRSAQQLRDNPLLTEILDEISTDCIEKWRSSDTTAQRESAWFNYQASERIREYVESRINQYAGDGTERTDDDGDA